MRLAKSYTHDMFQRDMDFNFKMRLDEPGLMRFETYSRFSRGTRHKTWIQFPEAWEVDEVVDLEAQPITGYYCDCKSGARTVGCCSHVAAVLWYLGYARHQPEPVPTPQSVILDYVIDAGTRPVVNVVAPLLNP